MKSSVEQLSPTRVRINVEVPFTELEPDFKRAYKELAKQVRLPGFRPGKAPAKLLEARFGREAMLDQVVNEALPARYGQAVAESEVQPIGQPDIEVTKKEYGEELAFTAEVDVRPKIDLPDLSALKVSVDPIEVSDDDVDARAAVAACPVRHPDRGGPAGGRSVTSSRSTCRPPSTARTCRTPRPKGLSHEVGSGRLIAGLDDALHRFVRRRVQGIHREVGDRRTRRARCAGHRHRQVDQGTRTARARRRVRPIGQRIRHHRRAADQPRDQVRQVKRAQQAEQIRNATLDALLEQVDVPLPEAIVQAQYRQRHARRAARPQPRRSQVRRGARRAGQVARGVRGRGAQRRREGRQAAAVAGCAGRRLGGPGRPGRPDRATGGDLAAIRHRAAAAVRLSAGEQPAAGHVRRCAARAGHRAVVEAATVTDTEGNTIDTSEFFGTHPRGHDTTTTAKVRGTRTTSDESRRGRRQSTKPTTDEDRRKGATPDAET